MRLLLPLLCTLAALAAVTGSKPTLCVCPAGFQPLRPDRCYHLVADGDFDSVQVACRSRGGHLIRITGEKEDDQARAVMTKHLRAMVWIGLRDGVDWRWTDGSVLNASDYSDWHREPGSGRCVVSWLHGGWQRRDCRLPAPGLCVHQRTPPQLCVTPPAQLPHGQQSHLLGGGDKWKLAPPPLVVPLPRLQWPPQSVHQGMVLRDAPAQWHQWL